MVRIGRVVRNTDQGSQSFVLNLAETSVVSAGIYDSNDTLIKTLFSAEEYPAGTTTLYWDFYDENGNLVPNTLYHVKSAAVPTNPANKVSYNWLPPIGNTSADAQGASVYHFTEGMVYGIVTTNTQAYLANGYFERQTTYCKFNLNDIQRKIRLEQETGAKSLDVCRDATRTYWLVEGEHLDTWVFAKSLADETDVTFTNGVVKQSYLGRQYNSAIMSTPDYDFIAGREGLAVQQSGTLVFRSRLRDNQVLVANKNTGQLLATNTVPLAGKMCVDNADNLWVITGTGVKKYVPNQTTGALVDSGVSLPGLNQALAVAYNPVLSQIGVCDSNGQVKHYNLAGVTNYKLLFKNTKRYSGIASEQFSAITFQADGSYWVADIGNHRLLHYDANDVYKEQIMNLGYFYCTTTHLTNNTRIFANYLEFAYNYTDNSWQLVNNYSYNVDPVKDDQFGRILHVVDLSDGTYTGTYGMCRNYSTGNFELIQLLATGLRYTGISVPSSYAFQNDGSLLYVDNSVTFNQPTYWKKKTFTSFTTVGGFKNPVFANAITVANLAALSPSDPITFNATGYSNQISSNNIITAFNIDNGHDNLHGLGFHLGGIKIGASKFTYRTARATTADYQGPFPATGDFDIGNKVNEAANFSQTKGIHTFTIYNGEFWKDSQTYMVNHFLDNGLFVGQFGKVGIRVTVEAEIGFAGNAKHGTLSKVGSDLYLTSCDEHARGGVHMYRISNLDKIVQQQHALTSSSKPADPFLSLNANLHYASNVGNEFGWTRFPEANSDQWKVITNNQTNERKYPDVTALFRPTNAGGSAFVKRDLGVLTQPIQGWKLEGEVSFLLGAYDQNADTGSIRLLDVNDKVLCQIRRRELAYGTDERLYLNQAFILQQDYVAWNKLMYTPQPFKLVGSASSITLTYAGYTVSVTDVVDATANRLQPKTLQLYFSSAGGREFGISLADLKYQTSLS
jgi:hypothetical protein